jgi:hypothetical protein
MDMVDRNILGRTMGPQDEPARQIAFWAAGCSALLSIVYVLAQLFEWFGALGSQGGPQSSSTHLGLVLLLTPSLLLASAFLVLMAALHRLAHQRRRVFTQIALAFATAYATLVSLVYFVQLTLVVPRLAAGDTAEIEVFLFVPYRSFLFAVDLLGYTFMCLAMLFGAFGLQDFARARKARAAMIATGALAPCLALQMYVPELIYVAALWALTFPASAILLAAMLRRIPLEKDGDVASA